MGNDQKSFVSARGWTELALRGMVLSSSRADLFIALGRFVPPVKKDSSLRVTFYNSELLISFFNRRNALRPATMVENPRSLIEDNFFFNRGPLKQQMRKSPQLADSSPIR